MKIKDFNFILAANLCRQIVKKRYEKNMYRHSPLYCFM